MSEVRSPKLEIKYKLQNKHPVSFKKNTNLFIYKYLQSMTLTGFNKAR
jgi:hypothetical protein